MTNTFKHIIRVPIMALNLAFLPVAFATDIAGHSPLPEFQNCQTATYISDLWNEDTKRSNVNDALAYKKLICRSGHEAFILLQADGSGLISEEKQSFSYRLIDHSSKSLSGIDSDMCTIVDKYCRQ